MNTRNSTPGSGGNGFVLNSNTGKTYCTIQAAIDDPQTLDGHVINVAAGTYIENLVLNKSLQLRGNNFGINPNTGMRNPESIIVPATSDPDPNSATAVTIMYLPPAASGSTIDGFTFDGDNPNLTSAVNINGANIDAIEAMSAYEGLSNVMVSNNIVKNLNYAGIDFYNYYNGGASTTGNSITENKFDNIIPTQYGIGALIYNNCYTSITDNVMTRVRVGIQTGNFTTRMQEPATPFQEMILNLREEEFFIILHIPTPQHLTFQTTILQLLQVQHIMMEYQFHPFNLQ